MRAKSEKVVIICSGGLSGLRVDYVIVQHLIYYYYLLWTYNNSLGGCNQNAVLMPFANCKAKTYLTNLELMLKLAKGPPNKVLNILDIHIKPELNSSTDSIRTDPNRHRTQQLNIYKVNKHI